MASRVPMRSPDQLPGSEKVGRAVRHGDQIARVQWPGQRREARTRYGDALDRVRHDVRLFRGIRGGLCERVIGMPARYQLDRHVGDDVPAPTKVTSDATARRTTVDAAVNLKEPVAGLKNGFFSLVSALSGQRRFESEHRR